MDTSKVQTLVDKLEDNIDDLEEVLQPIISQALGESTKKLPLLDKAKVHIVIVYAIESLLFSYLKLHNVDAKEHPIFRELTRVKQYFEKIKNAEEGHIEDKPTLTLNKQAAARIIKHSLAGNDKLDLARLEREAREKLLARRKLKDLEMSMKEKAQISEPEPESAEDKLVDQIAAEIVRTEGLPDPQTPASKDESPKSTKKAKKEKKRKREEESNMNGNEVKKRSEDPKANKKARKKVKKGAEVAPQPPV